MKILYNLYLNHTGYSVAAQENVFAIHRAHPEIDIKCRLFHNSPIGVSRFRQNFFQIRKSESVNGAVSIYQSVPDIYVTFPEAAKNVGFCVFESVTLPVQWVHKMNKMDIILTASEFNKGVFESNGVIKPIRVVPHCFDPEMFNKDVQPFGRYSLTTFLAMGQWRERKNWETLIRAFYEAFEKKDNVCLLIKTDLPEQATASIERIKRNEQWRSKDTCPIYSEPKKICQFEEIPYLMKKADFYVSPSLGEGFGLSGLHAMALHIPVITTRFGGVLQYAKPDNCTYIEPSRYEIRPSMDRFPQFKNAIWPVITVEEVAKRLREVFDRYPTEKTKNAYKYVHEVFRYDVVGQQFYEAII